MTELRTCVGGSAALFSEVSEKAACLGEVLRGNTYFLNVGVDAGGPGYRSRYSDLVRAGRSGDRILVGARLFSLVQNGPLAYQGSYSMATGVFPGGEAAGAWR